MGVGRKLVVASLGWFDAHGADRVTVVTQGRNIAAQRLYQRCGFLTRSTGLWYHRWFSEYRRIASDV
jgi:ribosomal protein S18 acetylase RimI-like enzyme